MFKEELTPRVQQLARYVQGLMRQENGKELYLQYKEEIERVTPQEVFAIFYLLLQKGYQPTEILPHLDKVINVFYKSLAAYVWEPPAESSFLGYLREENKALVAKLNEIKKIIKQEISLAEKQKQLLPKLRELQEFTAHYEKKENILFPLLEKKREKFAGLSIMWALHEEIKTLLKAVISYLERADCTESKLNNLLAKLIFAMQGLVKKEELILFPVASELFAATEWQEMQMQSLEYDFPFIRKPKTSEKAMAAAMQKVQSDAASGLWQTATGSLDFEQIAMILNTLPLDITYVDEQNKVRFFTRPKDRIFPRSPAVIGRDVKNCHPPGSVNTVTEIIESFRSGRQDQAMFWLQAKGKMILIQYFALRDAAGKYRGVLEVSQDITEITKLEGERRLLHWDNK
ncbi:MAG: DUF438 domain-containing protein [Firmicutes bacterium]|jgi:DUF438 domain-containing protein|nr:DUF438 domain-containing protein [Bacillota bacterium]